MTTPYKLNHKSEMRTRRPTGEELEALKQGLIERQNARANRQARIPFVDILEFGILTYMRIGEVCSLRWEEINEEHKTVVMRDRKDPHKKQGGLQ